MRLPLFIFLLALFVLTVNGSCPPGQLSCDDGKCIDSSKWCDKTEDCADESDEEYCSKKNWWNYDPNDCENTHFLCKDGRCVPKSAKCNGHSDCKDGTDEDKCEKSEEDKTSKEPENSSKESKISFEKPKTTSEEAKTSSEESKTSFEESKTSSEESKTSSEESKTSSKEVETSSKDSSTSSEESKTSSEESNDKKEDTFITDTPTESSSDYDKKRPNLNRATQSTPSSTTKIFHFFEVKVPEMKPVVNGYYDRKMTEFTTQSSRTNAPARTPSTSPPTSGGKFYPPPPPTFPKDPNNPSYTQIQPPSPDIYTHSTYNARHGRQPGQQEPANRGYGRTESNGYRLPGQQEPANRGYGRTEPNSYRLPGQQEPPNRGYGRTEPNSYRLPGQQELPNRGYGRTETNGYRQPGYQEPANRGYGRTQFGSGYLSPHVPSYARLRKVLPRFSFPRDFSNHRNDEFVSRGVDWILRLREPHKGWGTDTPRAIVALSLANDSYVHDPSLKNFLNLQVGLKLLKPEDLRMTELSRLILALLATCQDPSDFQGVDLGRTVLEKMTTHHPFTLLAACLAGQSLRNQDWADLYRNMQAYPDTEKKKDRLSLSLSAFSCYLQTNPSEQTRFESFLHNTTSRLLKLQLNNGSFGSVYSTAIAVQALMSLNFTLGWNPASAFNFLREHQNINGSFGDFLATYHVIPALKGRSLLHLRNLPCQQLNEELTPQEILDYSGEKKYLKYSLNFGYPISNAHSVRMLVPVGINFFDVMRVAEYQNKHFKFQYHERNEKTYVYSISDLPNDPELGLAWHLYVEGGHSSNLHGINENNDVRNLIPRPNEHYIFWYHRVGVHPQYY